MIYGWISPSGEYFDCEFKRFKLDIVKVERSFKYAKLLPSSTGPTLVLLILEVF